MRLLLMAVAAVIAFASPLTYAYEEDVHYGLTYWLAMRAGFAEAQAERIAAANIEYDRGKLSAISLVMYSACFGNRDRAMSQLVKEIHFPSDGPVPGTPLQRKVDAGSDAAHRVVRSRLDFPSTSQAENVLVFGQGLHSLQDSWSHQGIPGSPWKRLCWPELSWGHPDSRGGWMSHEADLTDHYVQDAVDMASATYRALCDFRAKFSLSKCPEPSESFVADIFAFSVAKTKREKADWFKMQGVQDVAFLDTITITDGLAYWGKHRPLNYWKPGHPPVERSDFSVLPSTAEARFMGEFFTAWATKKNLASLVESHIAFSAYRDGLAQGEPRKVDFTVVATQLAFWRVRDHGSVAQDHDLIALERGKIADIAPRIREADEPYPDAELAFLPFDSSGLPVVTWVWPQADGRTLFVGAVRFSHAPKDLVIVVADKIDGRLKVVSISSTLME
ncbi:hypothetical protein H0A66_06150 [Alcaligenaceae bacterium]|nr:hypothetical protein [Alcaligenaceae bacterium]